MPTYQYECSACGHDFEELQTMTDAKLTKCPKCGKKKLDRLIGSGAGMIFKGSGFYETDYKKKSPSASDAKSDSKTTPKTDSKTSAKTDAKPATPASGGGCGGGCACHPA